MYVPQEHARQNGDRVFLVVDMGHGRGESVYVVREGLIPDTRETVPDEGVASVRNVQREVDGVEEGNSRACWRAAYVRDIVPGGRTECTYPKNVRRL